MKTYEMLTAIETREERFQIRNGLRADLDALKKVYRETSEEGPAATVAAFVAAVGYSRAAVIIATLVNRHAWDGRISRRVASWAAEQPEAWDEKTAVELYLYVDDVIHLAHFDQIAREFMKTTPPEDPDKRPETISEDAAPETPETISAGTEAAPETAEARPETISEDAAKIPETVALAPEAFRAVVDAAPRCGLLFDLQGDCLRYKTEDGRKRCIYTDAVTIEHGDRMARIKYHNGSSRGQITLDRDHDCFPVAAVVAGTVTPSDALRDILTTAVKLHNIFDTDRDYFHYSRKHSGSRKEEAARNMIYGAKLADLAACIIKNAADGIPMFIEQLAAEMEAIAADAREIGQGLTAAKHAEAVAAWIRETVAACKKAAQETAAERQETISKNTAPETPETISAGTEAAEDNTIILVETCYDIRNGGQSSRRILYSPARGTSETIPEPEKAPEAVAVQLAPAPEAQETPAALEAAPESPETISAGSPEPEQKPEARPRRQAPEKPARGPGKPLDCIGQIISGNGWQIVFDGSLQRTRVIIEEAAREKAAPLAEAAGFYYSVNTDSWHKKLSHKARRAAEALAEQLRAACA